MFVFDRLLYPILVIFFLFLFLTGGIQFKKNVFVQFVTKQFIDKTVNYLESVELCLKQLKQAGILTEHDYDTRLQIARQELMELKTPELQEAYVKGLYKATVKHLKEHFKKLRGRIRRRIHRNSSQNTTNRQTT